MKTGALKITVQYLLFIFRNNRTPQGRTLRTKPRKRGLRGGFVGFRAGGWGGGGNLRLQPAAAWFKVPCFGFFHGPWLRFGFAHWRSGSGWASRLALGAMALPVTVDWTAASVENSAAGPALVENSAAGRKTGHLIIRGGFLQRPWVVHDCREEDGQPFLSVAVNNYSLALLVAGRVNDPAPRGRILSRLGVLQRIESARDASIEAFASDLEKAELRMPGGDEESSARSTLARLQHGAAGDPGKSPSLKRARSARALHNTGRWLQIPSKFEVRVRLASSPETAGVFTVLKSPKGQSAWIQATPTALGTLVEEAECVLNREPSVEATPPRRQRLRETRVAEEEEKKPRIRKVVWREKRQAWIAQAWTGEKHEYATFGLEEEPGAMDLAKDRAWKWVEANHQPKERSGKRRQAGKKSRKERRQAGVVAR